MSEAADKLRTQRWGETLGEYVNVDLLGVFKISEDGTQTEMKLGKETMNTQDDITFLFGRGALAQWSPEDFLPADGTQAEMNLNPLGKIGFSYSYNYIGGHYKNRPDRTRKKHTN